MQSIELSTINRIPAQRIERWVVIFIWLHLIIWTFAPAWVRYTLPMDALEGTTWGHQLQWGYDKNPFMNGWLTALAVHLGGGSGWTIYLFSQLSVALCFWCVWQLGKNMLPPIYAFAATVALAGMQYYNLHAIDFNDNTLELSLWAATTLYFYQALRSRKWQDWVLTGLFAGLGMMTKYFTVMLLLPMFLFMLMYPQTRAQFKKFPIYLGLCVFVLIITPHFLWLFSHDFVTVNYAFHRVNSKPLWTNHLFYPAQFAWQQIEVFLPTLFLLILLMIGRVKEKSLGLTAQAYDKMFLCIVGLGPFFLTVLLSAISGIKLRAGWGQPLLTFFPLCLLVWIVPSITIARLQRFIGVTGILLIGIAASYCVALMHAAEPSSANFPGKTIAKTLEREWHETYHIPLTYVVGPRWLAGNISFYSVDHPSVYMEANKMVSPWIDEEKLKRSGAIFVWDPTEEHQVTYADLKVRFPKLGEIRVMHFTWLRNLKMTPVEISVAILPPDDV
ncbi:MAG: glycosyltransferase family 39 protein [Gammaproteobacteria bacterium]